MAARTPRRSGMDKAPRSAVKSSKQASRRPPPTPPPPSPAPGDEPDFDPIDAVRGASTPIEEILAYRWKASNEPYISGKASLILRLAVAYARADGSGNGDLLVGARHLLWAQLASALLGKSGGFGMILRLSDESPKFFSKLLKPEDRALHSSLKPAGPEEPLDARAHWSFVEVLARASELRRQTNRRFRDIGQRHLFAAQFATKAGQTAFRELGAFSQGFEALRDAVIAALKVSEFEDLEDDLEAWRRITEGFANAEALVDRIERRPDYLNDRVAVGERVGREPLGAADDARALADLILLEAAEPPIAVGLFGPWGSGKSTLLEYLKAEVREQTRNERNRAQRDEDDTKRIVTNVVQLDFNAWTFADTTNLWAAFTAEVFDQLAAEGRRTVGGQGSELDQDSLHPQARAALAQLIDEIGSQRAKDEKSAHSAEMAIQNHSTALEQASKKIVEAKTERGSALLRALVDTAKDANVTLRKLDDKEDIGSLVKFFYSLRLAGWKYLSDGWRVVPWLVASAVLAILAFFFWRRLPDWGAWASAVGAFVALAAPALSAIFGLVRHWRTRRALADRQLEEARIQHRAEEAALAKAKAEKAKIDRSLEKRRADPLGVGVSSHQMLDYLLEDSQLVAAVRAQAGLLATVRRCFDQLDAMISQSRREARAAPAGRAEGARSIDRIILYIDDLDRCSTAQVSNVLQAVHLLLSFGCFVVIVAADANWLEQSLRAEHRQLFGDKPRGLTPADYLEKIFQIPFWVRPLVDADAHRHQDRYRPYETYVDHLLREKDAPAEDASPREVVGKPTRSPRSGGKIGKSFTRIASAIDEQAAPRRERIVLTPAEKEFIKKLGPLAAKSPRAVKRLINTYRLMRVRMDESHLAHFLAKGDNDTASFQAVLFALACEVGLPPTTMTQVAAALVSMAGKDDGQWAKLPVSIKEYEKAAAEGKPAPPLDAATLALIEALSASSRLGDFGLALAGLPADLAIRQVQMGLEEVRRYSFRPL